MRWRILSVFASLLVACGLVWPDKPWPDGVGACLGTDYSQRDTCYWLHASFTDDTLATGVLDHCDSAPQKDADPLSCGVAVTVGAGDAPTGSPAGSDSLARTGGITSICWVTADTFASGDFTVGGWWFFENAVDAAWIGHWGNSGAQPGWWHAARYSDGVNDRRFQWKTDGTFNSAGTSGFYLPDDVWSFIAWSHDATSGSGTMRAYSSQSQVAGSLFDCTGGTQICNDEATPMAGVETYFDSGTKLLSNRIYGATYETWFMAETLTEEELCEICRCGFRGDNGADRKSTCNNCDMGVAEPWFAWTPHWPIWPGESQP
jgi:hypothetical protein